MAGIRVPAHLRDTANQINAKKWVQNRKFPRDRWFEIVNRFREELVQLTGNDPPEYKLLVALIAVAVDAENNLIDHVLPLGVDIPDDTVWSKMCTAVSWVILQEYLKFREREGAA